LQTQTGSLPANQPEALITTITRLPTSPDYMPPELLIGARGSSSAAAATAAGGAIAAAQPPQQHAATEVGGPSAMQIDESPFATHGLKATRDAAGGASSSLQQKPNQQAAPPPYDAAAVDAWACGVLLYLLVTGVSLFLTARSTAGATS
jgi:hypothetical protein